MFREFDLRANQASDSTVFLRCLLCNDSQRCQRHALQWFTAMMELLWQQSLGLSQPQDGGQLPFDSWLLCLIAGGCCHRGCTSHVQSFAKHAAFSNSSLSWSLAGFCEYSRWQGSWTPVKSLSQKAKSKLIHTPWARHCWCIL